MGFILHGCGSNRLPVAFGKGVNAHHLRKYFSNADLLSGVHPAMVVAGEQMEN